jgi:Cft2 family RNA processing exonuclease
MTDTTSNKRNPLTADTEPLDEELAIVMREARDLALSRKRASDEWMRTTLAEVVAAAHDKDKAQVARGFNAFNVEFDEKALEIAAQRDTAIESGKLQLIDYDEFLKRTGSAL